MMWAACCRMRSAVITSFWAFSTIAVTSISYVATRTSGNLSDTMAEHSIASILSVSLSLPVTQLLTSAHVPVLACSQRNAGKAGSTHLKFPRGKPQRMLHDVGRSLCRALTRTVER